MILVLAGTISRELNQLEQAHKYFLDCLKLHHDSQNSLALYWCLYGLITVSLAQQNFEQALRLLPHLELLRPEPLRNLLGFQLSPFEHQFFERDMQILEKLNLDQPEAPGDTPQTSLFDLIDEQFPLA
jgi:tetratricopeptide (TPR) repeat protein